MIGQLQCCKQVHEARDQLSQEDLRDLGFGRRSIRSRRDGVGHLGFLAGKRVLPQLYYAAWSVRTIGAPFVITSVCS